MKALLLASSFLLILFTVADIAGLIMARLG